MGMLGFVVILILYATIGLMGAAGAVFLVRKFLRDLTEAGIELPGGV